MANYKRSFKNYLLDPSLQLKFAFYSVTASLVVAGLVGAFLFSTTRTLFTEMTQAVEARSTAAESSKELGNAALSAELLQHFEDPAFAKQLELKSKAIDAKFEEEKQAIVVQREDLVRRQKVFTFALAGALLGFVLLIGLASIVLTHKVAGPLLRIRRMVGDVANGKYDPPKYALRDGDELKDVFEDVSRMIVALKGRQEAALAAARHALSAAHDANAPAEVQKKLEELIAKLQEQPPAAPPAV